MVLLSVNNCDTNHHDRSKTTSPALSLQNKPLPFLLLNLKGKKYKYRKNIMEIVGAESLYVDDDHPEDVHLPDHIPIQDNGDGPRGRLSEPSQLSLNSTKRNSVLEAEGEEPNFPIHIVDELAPSNRSDILPADPQLSNHFRTSPLNLATDELPGDEYIPPAILDPVENVSSKFAISMSTLMRYVEEGPNGNFANHPPENFTPGVMSQQDAASSLFSLGTEEVNEDPYGYDGEQIPADSTPSWGEFHPPEGMPFHVIGEAGFANARKPSTLVTSQSNISESVASQSVNPVVDSSKVTLDEIAATQKFIPPRGFIMNDPPTPQQQNSQRNSMATSSSDDLEPKFSTLLLEEIDQTISSDNESRHSISSDYRGSARDSFTSSLYSANFSIASTEPFFQAPASSAANPISDPVKANSPGEPKFPVEIGKRNSQASSIDDDFEVSNQIQVSQNEDDDDGQFKPSPQSLLLAARRNSLTNRSKSVSQMVPSTSLPSSLSGEEYNKIMRKQSLSVNKISNDLSLLRRQISHSSNSSHSSSSLSDRSSSQLTMPESGPIAVGHALPFSSLNGYLNKFIQPTFGFSKQWKRRYLILSNNLLFCFKSADPLTTHSEYFDLKASTLIFVTNEFPGKLYVLEIKWPTGKTWWLQADNVEDMMKWMNGLKGAVSDIQNQNQNIESISRLPSTSSSTSSSFKTPHEKSSLSHSTLSSRPITVRSNSTSGSITQSRNTVQSDEGIIPIMSFEGPFDISNIADLPNPTRSISTSVPSGRSTRASKSRSLAALPPRLPPPSVALPAPPAPYFPGPNTVPTPTAGLPPIPASPTLERTEEMVALPSSTVGSFVPIPATEKINAEDLALYLNDDEVIDRTLAIPQPQNTMALRETENDCENELKSQSSTDVKGDA